ncbi:MAG: efflux RND transporter periplasmic adaptor subunit [Phycisphaerae bacterium]
MRRALVHNDGRPTRRAARVITVVLLLVVTARSASGQGHGPSQVEVAPVIEREVAPTIRLVGTVRPRKRSTVAAAVAGLVAELSADEGDVVKKGATVCRLFDAPRRYLLAEAEARVSELKARLAVERAEYKKAAFERERIEALWKLQRSTDKERSDTQADLDAAQGRVDQAKSAVEAARAVADRLAYELSRTEVQAPFDGIVSTKETEVGAWVDQGGPVITLLDLSTVRVRVNVPEAHIGYCEVGAEADVAIEALNLHFSGRITRVIPDADARARTFPVDVDIPNPTGRLKAGLFVRASVPSGPKALRLLVPKDAIIRRGPMPMIYVVRSSERGQMADMLPVKIVSEVIDYVAVESTDLSAGDSVVVRGNEFLIGPGPVIAKPSVRHQARSDSHSASGGSEEGDLTRVELNGHADPGAGGTGRGASPAQGE